jgi:uncharacterized DUF497 family protein
MPSMRFSWNRDKAAANRRKHGISFEVAARVFLDPHALSEQDRIEGGEHRWQTIGSVDGLVVLLVAHTVQDDEGIEVIHIISARKAGRNERKRYDEERHRRS